MANSFATKREPVELRGYFMRHKNGGDIGFSWQKDDPRFSDEWERIEAVPATSPSAPQGQEAAHDEMLDMLGRVHPLAMPRETALEQRDERLERAFVMQQPLPVPDQACVVWRWDLMELRHEVIRLRAYKKGQREQSFAAPVAGEAPAVQTQAARDVLAERQRQISVEGWTPGHDDSYQNFELNTAAACYCLYGSHPAPRMWPWPSTWWKPANYRRNLVKAGALVLAEIERLDRAGHDSANGGEGSGK